MISPIRSTDPESLCAPTQLPASSSPFPFLRSGPSAYYEHKAQDADSERRSARAQRDAELKGDIERAWEEDRSVYDHRFGSRFPTAGPRKARIPR